MNASDQGPRPPRDAGGGPSAYTGGPPPPPRNRAGDGRGGPTAGSAPVGPGPAPRPAPSPQGPSTGHEPVLGALLRRRLVPVVAAVAALVLVVVAVVVVRALRGPAGGAGPPTAGTVPTVTTPVSGSAGPSSAASGASSGPSTGATGSTGPAAPQPPASLPVSAALPPSTVVAPLKIDGQRDLYLVDTSRRQRPVRLPSPDGDDVSPTVQPGRGTIIYVNDGQLRVMAADGTGDRLLLEDQPKGCDRVEHVSWSWADPSLMALECETDDRGTLMLARLDGQVVRRLPVARRVVQDTSLSPDGTTLVFWASNDDDLDGGSVYSTPVDGSEQPTRLTREPAGTDADPVWSPDGSQIAFRRRVVDQTAEGDQDVWVMNFDGSDPRPLAHTPAKDIKPAWSPDGTQVLVVSNRTSAVGGTGKTWDLWLTRVKDGRVLRAMGLDAEAISVPLWWSR